VYSAATVSRFFCFVLYNKKHFVKRRKPPHIRTSVLCCLRGTSAWRRAVVATACFYDALCCMLCSPSCALLCLLTALLCFTLNCSKSSKPAMFCTRSCALLLLLLLLLPAFTLNCCLPDVQKVKTRHVLYNQF
jgi:hypothetical protein